MTAVQKPRVLVMMATYNGEKYVAEQIDSILAQQDVDVTLLITDDGSTDATPDICRRYENEFMSIFFRTNATNKGVASNFMDMVYEADATLYDYFAFSDQDDCWLPCKLIEAIKSIKKSGVGPRLYYSDVSNADSDLAIINREYAVFGPYEKSMPLLLTINWALGCTMVFNREFQEKLSEYRPPTWPRIHDVWVHMVALSCGWSVPDLDHAFIKRRLTGSNVVGAMNLGSIDTDRLRLIFTTLFKKNEYHFSFESCRLLLEGYSRYMDKTMRDFLVDYSTGDSSLFKRIRFAFDSRFYGPYPVDSLLYIGKMIANKY